MTSQTHRLPYASLHASFFLAFALVAAGCRSEPTANASASAATPVGVAGVAAEPPRVAEADRRDAAQPLPPVPAAAALGRPAPDFELSELDGSKVRLSDHRGKVVVLEWFNPGCPFVVASHTKGSLAGLAIKHAGHGVVWLAVNSAAPGKQGHGVDANRSARERFGMRYPVLLDESGQVGRAYQAKRTPHLFVIDAQGVLVYRGAIDNSPDGEGTSPSGGRLVNHVDAAVADALAGRPVGVPETEAYGCTVKYAE
jgi:peroxiredoxin